MQKIQTTSKSKTIDYGNEEINNFWLRINDNSNYQEENNNLEQIISVFNKIQDSIICVQTEKLNHSEIIKAIFDASKRRNRIYILTNEKDKDLQKLEGVCLIRYGIKNIGSFILINPNTSSNEGVIFTAPFIETSLANAENISLELDNEQVKTLFRFFSDNFWNKAEFEIIETFNSSKETGEAPLDFLPNIKDFCDADFVKAELLKINNSDTISVPNLRTNDLLNFTSLKNSTILMSLKNNDSGLLKTIAQNNNSINSITQNTSRIIIAENGNWLIPKTNISENDNFFALKLNKNQIGKLDNLIKNKIDNAEFEFNLLKLRKEVKEQSICLLNNIDNEILIKSKSEKTLPNISLNKLILKDEFEKQEPKFEDDNTSVEIEYKWQIIPFYTPSNAKKARLYQDWEKHQSKYNTFLKQIEDVINESGSKNIGENLKRWFLGKKQTITKQQKKLDSLKSKQLSNLEKSDRKEIIHNINELSKDVSANLFEIEIEIRKSEIQEEIDKLKEEKSSKDKELQVFIKEQESELAQKEAKKKEDIKAFCEKHKIKENELSKFRHKQTTQASKKNKKKNPKEAEAASRVLSELQEIEGFDFRKKFNDDKAKMEKEIKSLNNDIKSKENELKKVSKKKEDVEKSSLNHLTKNNDKKKTKSKTEFAIPETLDYLPKIGELFEARNKKYLEIEFWEDYKFGKKEAERLKAELSAKQN